MNAEQIAVKLLFTISEQIQDEDNENFVDLKEIDLTDFIHALANIMPTYVYCKLTGDNSVNNLEFNHIANKLCFQYSQKKHE